MPITSYAHCRVCRGPKNQEINDMLARGESFREIEREMRAAGWPIKSESVSKHFDRCLSRDIRNIVSVPAVAAAEERLLAGLTPEQREDFAVLVERKAIEELQAGRLRVSTKDGIAARALLDRREDRADSRTFMLNLARVLTGAGSPAPALLTGPIDEGEYVELPENPLLAPEALRR